MNVELKSSLRLINLKSHSTDEIISILDNLLFKKEKQLEEISNDISTLNDKINKYYNQNKELDLSNKELKDKVLNLSTKLKQELDDKEVLLNDNLKLEQELNHIKKSNSFTAFISQNNKIIQNSKISSNYNQSKTEKKITNENVANLNNLTTNKLTIKEDIKDKQSNSANKNSALASEIFDYEFMYD